MMKVILFRSRLIPAIYGYTLDEAGANLPDEFAPWDHIKIDYVNGFASQERLTALILKALREVGYSCVCHRSDAERWRLQNFPTISLIDSLDPYPN